MKHEAQDISVVEALKIAEKEVRVILGDVVENEFPIFSERHLEAEFCWMFFLRGDINISPDRMLGLKWAYAVSKKERFAMVQDLSSDEDKLQDYLLKMSDHFMRRNE
ncbi:hypothetical protein [Xanthomonas axonopodis]|uniref:hypothetical protein n=1 Tax=Xanthomonas axonopodis TaxID=53413 RepID=UPI0011160715|nr:hypothetical protein [Xanthomonas axonopodis]